MARATATMTCATTRFGFGFGLCILIAGFLDGDDAFRDNSLRRLLLGRHSGCSHGCSLKPNPFSFGARDVHVLAHESFTSNAVLHDARAR